MTESRPRQLALLTVQAHFQLILSVSLLVLSASCKVDLGDGYFACPDGKCPTGQYCHSDHICRGSKEQFLSSKDAGADADPDAASIESAVDSGDDGATPSAEGGRGGSTAGAGGAGRSAAGGGGEPPAAHGGSGGANPPVEQPSPDGGVDLPAFSVTSISPASGGTLSDVDAGIKLTFSAPIQPASVDSTSISIVRSTAPEAPIAGALAVMDSSVTFTPSMPWALAGTYTIQVTADVVDSAHNRAVMPKQSSFSVRDGKWTSQRLGDSDTSFADPPAVAVAPTGYAVAAWYSPPDAVKTAPGIWASRFTPGGSWSAPVVLETNAPTFRVQASVNRTGHAAVAWDYADGVYASTFTGGSSWNPRLTLDSAAYNPVLAINDSDTVYLALQSAHMSARAVGFTFAANATAIAAGDTHDVQAAGADSASDPTLAMLGGMPQVVWVQALDTAPASIWSNAFSTFVCDSCVKQLSAGGAASAPVIASDPAQGSALAVWQQTDPAQSNVAAARIVAGGTWSAATVVSDQAGAASQPAAAVDSTGHGLVVWKQEVASGSRILASTYTPGQGFSKSEVISAAVSDIVSAPVIAVEAGGSAVALWIVQSSTDVSVKDLSAARYVAGRGWQAAARQKLSSTGAVAESASVAIDSSGRAFAVWMEPSGFMVARFE